MDRYTIRDEKQVIDLYMSKLPAVRILKSTLTAAERIQLVFTGIARGDIAGSYWKAAKFVNPPVLNEGIDNLDCGNDEMHRFTDGTVLTCAVMEAAGRIKKKGLSGEDAVRCYAECLKDWTKRYQDAGYGQYYAEWAFKSSDKDTYSEIPSYGSGAAMRAAILGTIFEKPEDVIRQAFYSALPSHAHVEGVKGAIVTALAVWMALRQYTMNEILRFATACYDKTVNGNTYPITPDMGFNRMVEEDTLSISCMQTVPEAFVQVAAGVDYNETVRLSYHYRCDTDTVASIAGGIAAAFYGNADIIAAHSGKGDVMSKHEAGEKLFLMKDCLPDEMMEFVKKASSV